MTWHNINEIDAAEMPPSHYGKWWPLFAEIRLRLEKTPPAFALQIEMESSQAAVSAQRAITRIANRSMGKGAVVVSQAVNGKPYLYARRGENWK